MRFDIEERIYERLPTQTKKNRAEELKQTQVGTKETMEQLAKESLIKQIHEVLLATVVFLILLIALFAVRSSQAQHITIARNDTGGETKEEQLIINKEKDLTLQVDPKGYTKEQVPKVLEKGSKYLLNHLKGENISLNQVNQPLFMPENIPGENIGVRWESDDPATIDEEGNVFPPKEDKIVQVRAILSCQGQEKVSTYPVCVVPKPKSAKTKEEKVAEVIRKKEADTKANESFQIPKNILGTTVSKVGESSQISTICFLGAIVIGLLWYRRQKEIKEQVKVVRQEGLLEYPIIMNQLLLYLGAGLSVPVAMDGIYNNYLDKKQREIFVYEQIGIACRKINLGISQTQVFQDFGKEMRLPCYGKLTTLLVRSITQGSKDLFLRLKEEEEQAFFDRKQQAKRLGEEASTKLLAPMVVMLVIILALLMFPALASFS